MTDGASASLRRDEAERRAALIRVRHTAIELDLTVPGDLFDSTSTLTVECRRPGESTFLDFAGVEVTVATVDGEPFEPAWDGRRIQLPPLPAVSTVVVGGRMRYSTDGEGLHRHVDPADQQTYLYAMLFLDAGPRWFACFDQPNLKSPYAFHITAPPDWTVAGNGPAVAESAGRWRIEQPRPLSTYFVTLVAGPYATVTATHDGIPLALHAPASMAAPLAAQAADILQVTAQCFDAYHRRFGVRYPFGEYHQAFVPDFNAGAMENPGCVTLRAEFLPRGRSTMAEAATRAGVIAHEMAHQWFGDLVTMAWWDDLWLNESFAEYLGHRTCAEATRYDVWTEFGIVRKDWGLVADQAPSTHPVAGNGSTDAASALADFDGISYAKGAAILRQLAELVGDEVFFGGLADYFERYAYGNAALADLMAAWTRAGADGLDEWSQGWLRTAGLDTLAVQPADDGVGVVVARIESPLRPVSRTHAVTLAAVDDHGVEVARRPVIIADDPVTWVPPAATRLVVPDAENLAWAKLRFAGGWAEAVRMVGAVVHTPTRIAVSTALRDGVRDGELDPAAALEGLLELAGTDESDTVVQRTLTFAQDVLVEQYTTPARQAQRRARIHHTAMTRLARTAAGSDLQLTAFRAAIRSADEVEVLRVWLAGDLPVGISPDDDLRWRLVQRITSIDDDPELIEATLAADPSASGRRSAFKARAGRPDPDAKAAAWRILAAPSDLSAYDVYATAEGFFLPGQQAWTDPYVDRYFTEIGGTAAFRAGWFLGQVATYAFPSTATGSATVERAEVLLSGPLAAPVRRAVTDQTDRLRRAVRSLQRFNPDALPG